MPYLVKGNAEQLFNAFGQHWAVAEGKDESGTIRLDFPRTHFIGSNEQALTHFNTWRQKASVKHYLQGNMSAGNLWCILGVDPLMNVDEGPEIYHQNFVRQHFAYINDKKETCGFMLMYRKDNPKQWMIGLVKNAHAAPKERELTYLSSFDLAPLIQSPDVGISVSSVELCDNPLAQPIGSDLVNKLVQNVFNMERGEINLRALRIDLLMRTLKAEQDTAQLYDPIALNELNWLALFAESPALDLLTRYNDKELPLSFAMLNDLLSDSSGLRKEIEAIKLSTDEHVNRSILSMLVTFYEKGNLGKDRHLLNDHAFVKTFSGFLWDKLQIKLIPFLMQKKYDPDLIRLILSEPAYYGAINKLVDLEAALTQDVPEYFKDANKRQELTFIHTIKNKDCQLLCLIFWVKGSLSIDGYQEIVEACQKYPLLASTLVALNQTKTKEIDDLRKIALTPQLHLLKSFAHHYAKELKGSHIGITKLKELEAASVALMLLKQSGFSDPSFYQLILKNDNAGQTLRLLLPQLANSTKESHKKSLIDILYIGVKRGIQSQGKEVLKIEERIEEPKIKDPSLLALAKSLRERFICVTQVQDLGFKDQYIALAAQEDLEEAKRFRRIILRVEDQCKVIFERFSSDEYYKDTLEKWNGVEANYRKALYSIAFDGLMNPKKDFRYKLQLAEKTMLDIVDPKIKSNFYYALIILANIVITGLTFSLANEIKYRKTGNYWFFNQTKAGEEVRALDKEVSEQIELEKTQESLNSSPIAVY
jgi:hypothetical protein